jgi:hypothetical protein
VYMDAAIERFLKCGKMSRSSTVFLRKVLVRSIDAYVPSNTVISHIDSLNITPLRQISANVPRDGLDSDWFFEAEDENGRASISDEAQGGVVGRPTFADQASSSERQASELDSSSPHSDTDMTSEEEGDKSDQDLPLDIPCASKEWPPSTPAFLRKTAKALGRLSDLVASSSPAAETPGFLMKTNPLFTSRLSNVQASLANETGDERKRHGGYGAGVKSHGDSWENMTTKRSIERYGDDVLIENNGTWNRQAKKQRTQGSFGEGGLLYDAGEDDLF